MAFRALSVSWAVTRRDLSKLNSFERFIEPPFATAGFPGADQPVGWSRGTDRKDDHQNPRVRLADEPFPCFMDRVLGVLHDPAERIVESGDGLLEGDAVLG